MYAEVFVTENGKEMVYAYHPRQGESAEDIAKAIDVLYPEWTQMSICKKEPE